MNGYWGARALPLSKRGAGKIGDGVCLCVCVCARVCVEGGVARGVSHSTTH